MAERPFDNLDLSEHDRNMIGSQLEQELTTESNPEFTIALAIKGTPEYEDAIPLDLEGNETPEQIQALIQDELPTYFWWKDQEWKEKDIPLETVEFSFVSGKKIELFNWFRPLSEEELEEIRQAVEIITTADNGKAAKTLRYILVDDRVRKPLATGDPQNGYGKIAANLDGSNGISLNPPAFSGRHRAADMSNLKGTVLHEGSHHIATFGSSFLIEWEQRFGWYEDEPQAVEARSARCVSEYAKTKSDEDVCDSVVARIGNNPDLDPEKARMIDELILSSRIEDAIVSVKKTSEDVALPDLPSPIYYKARGFKISIGSGGEK